MSLRYMIELCSQPVSWLIRRVCCLQRMFCSQSCFSRGLIFSIVKHVYLIGSPLFNLASTMDLFNSPENVMSLLLIIQILDVSPDLSLSKGLKLHLLI